MKRMIMGMSIVVLLMSMVGAFAGSEGYASRLSLNASNSIKVLSTATRATCQLRNYPYFTTWATNTNVRWIYHSNIITNITGFYKTVASNVAAGYVITNKGRLCDFVKVQYAQTVSNVFVTGWIPANLVKDGILQVGNVYVADRDASVTGGAVLYKVAGALKKGQALSIIDGNVTFIKARYHNKYGWIRISDLTN